MEDLQVREQFNDALSSFIERAKQDSRVMAIIVYGSMAYDEVTERGSIEPHDSLRTGFPLTFRSTVEMASCDGYRVHEVEGHFSF